VFACTGCSASAGNTIKNRLNVFERGENLLQYGILDFGIGKLSEIKLES